MVSNAAQIKLGALNPLLKIGLSNLIVSIIAFTISSAAISLFIGGSVLTGTVIGIINLSVLTKTIKTSFLFDADRAQRFVIKRYYLRLIVTFFVIGILIAKNLVNPVGLIIGLTIITITTLVSTIYFAKREEF
ncbi:MAG: hypothetical protein A2X87_04845 [Deltaproteobacteria bacterium GWC2_42_51]|nr:MAG: hypothetical protein A2056_01655 [Deltaproteobacteria bacterium GWA2_42_85]OGP28637.1 MAG: hypothetical protein A2067_02470 [Deltaproteobacteria bacterium GWB2_42_7]OGP31775.1 MAG: hypothetical protein A2X87_04845 [Deltaproteobacteria bacterium GWC2_42_51]OGP38812.1 MAG: hypothetical protein A2090_00290 [Deltaproteobacteria bacterium GWD2_42_10]OGP47006.1 MAG: hypothetical protein A2022_06995 [Deltaproteobacteria bacterium GWF2_42_12]OGQ24148.1 MAG: hypothetical protein A3D29_07690 [De